MDGIGHDGGPAAGVGSFDDWLHAHIVVIAHEVMGVSLCQLADGQRTALERHLRACWYHRATPSPIARVATPP